MRSWTGVGGLEKKITRKGQGLFTPYMMLLAEATPKIWSSGYTLKLGFQKSGSTQVQGLQNRPLAINATQQTPNLEKEKET